MLDLIQLACNIISTYKPNLSSVRIVAVLSPILFVTALWALAATSAATAAHAARTANTASVTWERQKGKQKTQRERETTVLNQTRREHKKAGL